MIIDGWKIRYSTQGCPADFKSVKEMKDYGWRVPMVKIKARSPCDKFVYEQAVETEEGFDLPAFVAQAKGDHERKTNDRPQ